MTNVERTKNQNVSIVGVSITQTRFHVDAFLRESEKEKSPNMRVHA